MGESFCPAKSVVKFTIHCVNFGEVISSSTWTAHRAMPSAYCFLCGLRQESRRLTNGHSIGL
jgi:hypothetical protein